MSFFYFKNLVKRHFSDVSVIEKLIKTNLKEVSKLEIIDISGGCGASFSINVSSSDFKGKSIIQQHRMINDILKPELKEVHAIQIKTSIPPSI